MSNKKHTYSVLYIAPKTLLLPNIADAFDSVLRIYNDVLADGWQLIFYESGYPHINNAEDARFLAALAENGMDVNSLAVYGDDIMQMTEMDPFDPVGGDADGNTD